MRHGSDFYEHDGTKLQAFPLPATLPLATAAVARLAGDRPGGGFASALSPSRTPRRPRAWPRRRAVGADCGLEMIAAQERLDWECYRLYGLVDDDLTDR